MSYYIYKHYNSDNQIVYVGQTKNLEKRQGEHFLNSKWKNEIHRIEYVEVTDKMLMDLYEKYYIDKDSPKYNKKDVDCQYTRFFNNLEELNFKEFSKEDIKETLLNLSDDSLGKLFKLYLINGRREISVENIGKILNTKSSATYLLIGRFVELNLLYKNKNGKYVLNDKIQLPNSFSLEVK